VAVDLSSARRQLAKSVGADCVVDPTEEDTVSVWKELGGTETPVVFNTVGSPGFLHELMLAIPSGTHVVQTGLHMGPEPIRLLLAIFKNLNLQFVLGYTPEELLVSLMRIADGTTPAAKLVTAEVGFDEVDWAFAALEQPDHHAKILIEPTLSVSPSGL
jgi:threonine dehydrogenase-like Zn-dependent dehydrogenase